MLMLVLTTLLVYAYYLARLAHWRVTTRFMVCEELNELNRRDGLEGWVKRRAVREREQELSCWGKDHHGLRGQR
jgi:hypothetical protein